MAGVAAVALAGLVSLGVFLATSSPGSGKPGATGNTVQGSGTAAGGPSSTSTLAVAGPPACAKGSLRLVGSTAFLPIAQAAAEAYMHDCTGATIVVQGGDSAYGLSQVEGTVASGSSAAGSTIGMYDGSPSASETAGLKPYPMGLLIYSVVAHAGLFPSSNITPAMLDKLWEPAGIREGPRA